MPHESFFKLDEEKRKKIIDAIEKEFGSNSFEKASINKIVEEAGISKGSFWFYFENKEDAIEYIIDSHTEMEKQLALKFLKENDGDVFQTYIDMFDFLNTHQPPEEKRELFPNICRNLIIDNKKFFKKFEIPPKVEKKLIEEKEFIETLDKNLIGESKEEIFALLKHLNYALRSNLLDSLTNSVSKETARKNFLIEIEIIKGGIKRNA